MVAERASRTLLASALGATLLAAASAAWAGRPLSTEDAGAIGARTCQLESWTERAAAARTWVLAPACGVTSEFEIDGSYALPDEQTLVRAEAELALKYVPADAHLATALGSVDFALKATYALERPTKAAWRGSEASAWLVASWRPSDAWAIHANLGTSRDRSTGSTAAGLNLALTWVPRSDVLLFIEGQDNARHEIFGPSQRSAGARYWLIGDRLALDVSAIRAAGEPTLWTLGLGWYGLAF